jgi:uncharacterized RDD family membrane protein YckC
LAPIGRRFGGLVVDELIVAVPVAIVAVVVGFDPSVAVTSHWLLALNIGLVTSAFVYETLLIAAFGRTVGKIAFGTRVVRAVDGTRPTWTEAVIRALVPLALGAIPRVGMMLAIVGYSLALWNPLRQGLHDRAAGTLVVRNTAS